MGLGKSFGVNLVAAVLVLAGCDQARSLMAGASDDEQTPTAEPEQTAADAEDEAAEAKPDDEAKPTEPKPVNEAQVRRFDDEQAVPEDINSGQVFAETSVLLDAPEDGKVIATLTKGAKLEKTAEHGKHTLVIASNPEKESELLLGWIDRGALLEIAPTSSTASAEETAPEPTVPPTTPPTPAKPTPPKPPPPKTVAPKPAPKPTPKPAPKPAPTPKKKKKKKGDTG